MKHHDAVFVLVPFRSFCFFVNGNNTSRHVDQRHDAERRERVGSTDR